MNIIDCNFDTWSYNHSIEHKDKMFRELYPYKVFSKIDFDVSKLNIEQKVEFNYSDYFVEIDKIELQENGRYRTTFSLNTLPKSEAQKWKHRNWNEKFQIVYTQDNKFITVFTKNEDTSKLYIKQFFNSNFSKISDNKSIPISDLLFRTLISNLCEDIFGKGDFYTDFKLLINGHRELPKHEQFFIKNRSFFSPIYSKERKLWICHAFNEEKAHRIGFYNGNQCDKLYVIYCNPTYTRHHRCNYPNVFVVSLFEFTRLNSKILTDKYISQIRFLQNHLNPLPQYSENELIVKINESSNIEYEIYKSELMEALALMKIVPNNQKELFHYISAINLLNAWINKNKNKKDENEKLFRDMYYFKSHLANVISKILSENSFDINLYIEKDLLMVEIEGFQFSFHNVPITETLQDYMSSSANIKIEWKGKRLQPIAPLLFRYSHFKQI